MWNFIKYIYVDLVYCFCIWLECFWDNVWLLSGEIGIREGDNICI